MLVYNYDKFTKEYTGYEEAALNPEETKIQGHDVYLIPANATDVKPPKTAEHETVLYNNGWEKVADYRNEYIVNDDMQPFKYDKLGDLPEGYICITEAQAKKIQEDDLYYVISDGGLIPNPNYEEEKQAREDAEFNKQFFNTSLGYVRRAVTMKDGNKKDFLTDILPLLVAGVPILVYTRQLEQSKVLVTDLFINECKQQLLIDFYGGE
jgi:hypothetical protein